MRLSVVVLLGGSLASHRLAQAGVDFGRGGALQRRGRVKRAGCGRRAGSIASRMRPSVGVAVVLVRSGARGNSLCVELGHLVIGAGLDARLVLEASQSVECLEKPETRLMH